ncbi:uncharacterized protein UTRI_03275 [Ustilago trichophora]|uniref:Uncharacterized protein n=1 Tax=Ustilago trichophora TaxID=86804 RepID=A0A5C3E6Z9_9BASI|nr:uncharacterized protein UTRI_03275 [Ustilago trichophora]
MASIISEPSPSFLDHLHCSVCYRSYVVSSRDASSNHHYEEGGQESFWIGECKHVLCYKDLSREFQLGEKAQGNSTDDLHSNTGGDGPDTNLLPEQIQGICASCSQNVRWIRLRPDHLPEPVCHLLAPVETSMSMLTAAYEFRAKSSFRFLKAKTLEQKQVFEGIRKEFRQFRNLKAELEEARAENRNLKAKIVALQPPPLNDGGVVHPQNGRATSTIRTQVHRMANSGRCFSMIMISSDIATARALSRNGPDHSRTEDPCSSPTKQEAGSMQRQSSKSSPICQRPGQYGVSGENSQRKSLGSRSFPTLSRDESQLRRSDKASSWSAHKPANSDMAAGPFLKGAASVPVTYVRPDGEVSGSHDVAMPHEQHLKAEK